MIPQIKLIILDFDGTLCDTRNTIVKTLQMTMQHFGLEVLDEYVCATSIGLPLKEAFQKLHPQLDDEEATACADTYRIIFEDNKDALKPKLFPEVLETLRELAARGYDLTIASSRSNKSLLGFVEETGLSDIISMVVGANDVVNAKPHPEPVLKIMEARGVKAVETLVVGDMHYDINMGRNAGAYTCGVTYGNGSREELEGCNADFVIDRFSELISLNLN